MPCWVTYILAVQPPPNRCCKFEPMHIEKVIKLKPYGSTSILWGRKLLRRVLTTITFSLDSISSKTEEVLMILSKWAGVTLEALKQGQPSHTHTHCHQYTNLWGVADRPSTEKGSIASDFTGFDTSCHNHPSWWWFLRGKVWDIFGSQALNATWSPSFGVLHLSLRWDDSKSGVARTCWERAKSSPACQLLPIPASNCELIFQALGQQKAGYWYCQSS